MCPMTPAAAAFDQAMAIQKRMNGGFGRHADIPVQSPHQKHANPALHPMALLDLKPDDQATCLESRLA